jgi:hypothetical protein
MLSGHIYDGDSLESSRRVLTWHDESPYRFWVGSTRSDSGMQEIQSFEIQVLKPKSLRPSEEEKKTRLRLISNGRGDSGLITASEFRKLPLGEILLERAELLMATMQREARRQDSVVLLHQATPRTSNTSSRSRVVPPVSGASSQEAIFIAKIYVDQCSMSTVRAAQRTAEYLGVEKNLVHVALKIARRNEWLTSSGSGKAGGNLTEKGKKEFQKTDGATREAQFQKKRGSK